MSEKCLDLWKMVYMGSARNSLFISLTRLLLISSLSYSPSLILLLSKKSRENFHSLAPFVCQYLQMSVTIATNVSPILHFHSRNLAT